MAVTAFVCLDLNAVVSSYSTPENALAGFSPTRTCLSSNLAAGDPMERAPCSDQPFWMVRASFPPGRLFGVAANRLPPCPDNLLGM